jgi:hypothetical protein
MENYRIQFDEGARAEVLRILRQHNDVVIDNVDAHSVGITIEGDHAEELHQRLLEEIDQEVSRYQRQRDGVA